MAKTIKKKSKRAGMMGNSFTYTEKLDSKKEEKQEKDINFILTDHALERMQERNISRDDIIRILKTRKYNLVLSQDYNKFPEYVREYLEESDDPNNFLKIITNNVDNTPTVITVIRNKQIHELFTPTAMKSMEMNNITIDNVMDIIESNPPESSPSPRDSERISFTSTTFPKITVYTNREKNKIISVFKNKRPKNITKKGGKKSRKKKIQRKNTYKNKENKKRKTYKK